MRHAPTLDFGPLAEAFPILVICGGLILSVIGVLLTIISRQSNLTAKELTKCMLCGAFPLIGWLVGLVLLGHGMLCIVKSVSIAYAKRH